MSDKIFKPVADVFALIHAGGEPYQWTQDAILAAEWLRDNPNYSVKEFVSLERYQAAVTDDLSALQQKLDAVLAKGMELAQEAAHVYAEYNKEMAPDVVCDGQTIQEFYDLANGWSSVESYLNEVRAEGVEIYAQSLRRKQEDAFTESEYRHTKLGRAAVSAEKFAAQLRTGSTEGGV